MNKLLAIMFVLVVSVTLACATMIYGWGLEPKSWPCIIGLGLFGQAFMKVIADVVIKEND